MRKTIVALAALFILSGSAISAQKYQFPDLTSSDWQFVPGQVQIYPVSDHLVIVNKIYVNQDLIAIVTVLLDANSKSEDEVLMLYGSPNDPVPMSALKIDGKWYVSSEQNKKMPNVVYSKNSDGNNIGASISIETDEGIKTRVIVY